MMRSDGGNEARSPGRSRISRKTIAQGRPVVRLVPVVLPRAFLLHADHGCERHPAFPAPSDLDEGDLIKKPRTPCAARMRTRVIVLCMAHPSRRPPAAGSSG